MYWEISSLAAIIRMALVASKIQHAVDAERLCINGVRGGKSGAYSIIIMAIESDDS